MPVCPRALHRFSYAVGAASILATVSIAACDRDAVAPAVSNLKPRSMLRQIRPVTYSHVDRGCYLWGPDPLASFWQSWGDPTELSVCGRTVSLEGVLDTGTVDNQFAWYRIISDGIAQATAWVASRNNGTPAFAEGPVIVRFDKPVTNVHVLWYCSSVPGNTVTAYNAAAFAIETHEAPVNDITQC